MGRILLSGVQLAWAWTLCSADMPAPMLLQRSAVPSANDIASGKAEAAKVAAQNVDVTKKLAKEVDQLAKQSDQKVKSLKAMLTTNSKAIAALTGLFKEVSKLTHNLDAYEAKLAGCRKELAEVKSQNSQVAEDEGYLDSVGDNDPLLSFVQKGATSETHANLAKASHLLSAATSLLETQRHHHRHHHRQPHVGPLNLGYRDSAERDSTTDRGSSSDTASTDSPSNEEATNSTNNSSETIPDHNSYETIPPSISFGLSTVAGDEEDMGARVQNVDRSRGRAVPGLDPLEYGMYDFSGQNGIKIFDHDSLDPDVQRKRELAAVNNLNRLHKRHAEGYDADDDDDDEDD